MTMIFTSASAAADYGTLGRWLLLMVTCLNLGSQFACMGITSALSIFTANLVLAFPGERRLSD
jgi:hypothetical protein